MKILKVSGYVLLTVIGMSAPLFATAQDNVIGPVNVQPDRPERPDQLERPDRPERAQRPDRLERPERAQRLERVARLERAERPARVERPERQRPQGPNVPVRQQ